MGIPVGSGRVSGNHQSGVNGVSQVDGGFRFCTCLCLQAGFGEGSTKEQWHVPAFPFRRASLTTAPTALSLKLDNSVSPLMFLLLFELPFL